MKRSLASVALASFLVACGSSAPPVTLKAGESTLVLDPDAVTLTLQRTGQPLLRLPGLLLGTADALEDTRSYDPYVLVDRPALAADPPPGLRFLAPRALSVLSSGPDEVRARLEYDDGVAAALTLRVGGADRFQVDLVPERGSPRPVVFARLQLRGDAQEGYYGLGMWADGIEHRGKARPMQLEVDTTESSNNEARVPVPLLVSTRGWGLFAASRRVGVFEVAAPGTDQTDVTYNVAGDDLKDIEDGAGLRFHLMTAPHPLDLPRRYFAASGPPLLPAPWALGPWLWRNESRDQAQVLDDIKKLRQLDLATSALWLDRPYASAVNSFDFDPKKYTDPDALIAAAHAAGLRMALWSTPYLESTAQPLLNEAQQRGYFPPRVGLLLNGWGKPIDFTNPAAYSFWQGLIHRYTDRGIEGFKLDYGEDVVAGLGGTRGVWKFADGSDERTMQHRFIELYHRVYAETLPRDGGFLLCRTGRWGDQKNVSVVWPGDMDATFTRYKETFMRDGKMVTGVGGLPATVLQALGLSTSGFPFFGADTGGYRHSPPDKELYIRWFQQTALSAVMQVGDASSQPVWEFTQENGRDDATVALFRIFARLHLRLFPYEWTLAQRLRDDSEGGGRPILRPVGLAYPTLGQHLDDEYLFGDDLLVAPVLTRGQTRRSVLLPPGDWIDWFDGSLRSGGASGATVEVAAPLDKLPLFLRAGALVPLLRPSIDTLAPASDAKVESFASDPGILYVRVAPGPAGRFQLFDGATIAQENGGKTLRFQAGSRFQKGAVLEVLRAGPPQSIKLDGQPLTALASDAALEVAPSGWYYDRAVPGTLWLRLPNAAAEQVVTAEW